MRTASFSRTSTRIIGAGDHAAFHAERVGDQRIAEQEAADMRQWQDAFDRTVA